MLSFNLLNYRYISIMHKSSKKKMPRFHGKIARYPTTFKAIHIFVTSLLGCKFVDIGEPRTLIPTKNDDSI